MNKLPSKQVRKSFGFPPDKQGLQDLLDANKSNREEARGIKDVAETVYQGEEVRERRLANDKNESKNKWRPLVFWILLFLCISAAVFGGGTFIYCILNQIALDATVQCSLLGIIGVSIFSVFKLWTKYFFT